MIEDKIGFNSAYISMNLLDELDYCLGGYGKPNIEFLFSLNTFVESFIASSSFYTSLDELNHLNLTAPALFPNGRPILNMLVKAGGLKFVNGVVDKIGTEIYRSDANGLSRKEAQQEFIIGYGKEIGLKYFLRSDINKEISNIPLITSTMEEDDFVVSEVITNSNELVSNLQRVSRGSSIQTTLPIYLYKEQITSLFRTPLSIDSLEKLAKLHEANLADLVKTLNFQYLPVPPFTSILLDQVTSVSEIPQKLMQLRNDFQELRNKFVELEAEIFDAVNLKQQQEAFNRFEDFWSAFIKKYTDRRNRIWYGILDLSEGVNIDKGVDKYVDESNPFDAFKDLNLGKLGGNILTKGYKIFQERKVINRYKGLTNLWELFQSGKGIEGQLRHFERLFGIQYSNAEISNVHRFVKKRLSNLTDKIGK